MQVARALLQGADGELPETLRHSVHADDWPRLSALVPADLQVGAPQGDVPQHRGQGRDGRVAVQLPVQ